jgi:hypothetical protein
MTAPKCPTPVTRAPLAAALLLTLLPAAVITVPNVPAAAASGAKAAAERERLARESARRYGPSYSGGRWVGFRRDEPRNPGDVDLKAPGGVELFFELTRRNSR